MLIKRDLELGLCAKREIKKKEKKRARKNKNTHEKKSRGRDLNEIINGKKQN